MYNYVSVMTYAICDMRLEQINYMRFYESNTEKNSTVSYERV